MNNELEDILKHYGVKGMKWGIRRYQPYPKGQGRKGKFLGKKNRKTTSRQNGNKTSSRTNRTGIRQRVREELQSRQRERDWKKVVNNMRKMNTKDISAKARRLQMENDLKRLSKSVGNKKDKADYRRRANMSDQELSRKVTRLRAMENMTRNYNEATKEQRDIGKKVVNVAGSLAVTYVANKKLTVGDVVKSITNPNQSASQTAKNELINAITKRVK